jgi:hypothetical protein
MGRGADGSAVKSQVAPLYGWPEKRFMTTRRFPPPWHGPSIIRPARDGDVLPAFRMLVREESPGGRTYMLH